MAEQGLTEQGLTEPGSTEQNCQQWLAWAQHALASVATDPLQEARWLLMAALDCSAADLMLNPDRLLTPPQINLLAGQVAEIQAGKPLAYVLESWSFYGLDVRVTKETLIPRPETEELVTALLNHLTKYAASGQQDKPLQLLDLGTGSGAIALALAQALPKAEILATDRSPRALAVASANAEQLGLTQISWACMDWCAALQATPQYDAIVSNPPYLRADDPHLNTSIAHEPISALVSGPTGLEDLEEIANAAAQRLRPQGILMMEHGYDQGPAARSILQKVGFEGCHTLQDLAGQDRVVVGHWQRKGL